MHTRVTLLAHTPVYSLPYPGGQGVPALESCSTSPMRNKEHLGELMSARGLEPTPGSARISPFCLTENRQLGPVCWECSPEGPGNSFLPPPPSAQATSAPKMESRLPSHRSAILMPRLSFNLAHGDPTRSVVYWGLPLFSDYFTFFSGDLCNFSASCFAVWLPCQPLAAGEDQFQGRGGSEVKYPGLSESLLKLSK